MWFVPTRYVSGDIVAIISANVLVHTELEPGLPVPKTVNIRHHNAAG